MNKQTGVSTFWRGGGRGRLNTQAHKPHTPHTHGEEGFGGKEQGAETKGKIHSEVWNCKDPGTRVPQAEVPARTKGGKSPVSRRT